MYSVVNLSTDFEPNHITLPMGMIKCPECGNSVSDTANSCPNCGYDFKSKRDVKENLFTCLFWVVVIGACIFFSKSCNSCSSDSENSNGIPSFLQVNGETVFTFDKYEIHLFEDKTAEVILPVGSPIEKYKTTWEYVHNEGSFANKPYDYYYIVIDVYEGIYISIRQDGKVMDGNANYFTNDPEQNSFSVNATRGARPHNTIDEVLPVEDEYIEDEHYDVEVDSFEYDSI